MSFADHFKAFHEIEIDNHIRLRRHQPQQDAEAFFHICSDRDAFRFFGRETYPGDQYADAFVHVLEKQDQRVPEEKRVRMGHRIRRGTHRTDPALRLPENNTSCTIGYFLKRAYWNRGINTRCVKGVCDFALHDMGLVRIEAYAHVDNIASNRIAADVKKL